MTGENSRNLLGEYFRRQLCLEEVLLGGHPRDATPPPGVLGGDSIALKCAGGDDGGNVLVLGGVGGDD